MTTWWTSLSAHRLLDPERARRLVAPCVQPGEPWGYRVAVELAFERRGQRAVVGTHDAGGTGAWSRWTAASARAALPEAGYSSPARSRTWQLPMGLAIDRVGIRASSRRTRDVEAALWTSRPVSRAHRPQRSWAMPPGHVHRARPHQGPEEGAPRRRRGAPLGAGSWTELARRRAHDRLPSFFQVNTKGAEKLADLVLAGLAPNESDVAMDLYQAPGRSRCRSRVDLVGGRRRVLRLCRARPQAQSQRAGSTTRTPCMAMPTASSWIPDADVIVAGPAARAGLAQDVVRKLVSPPAPSRTSRARDPATLARDLRASEQGGHIRGGNPSRPWTCSCRRFHVEDVTILRRR